MRVENKNGLSQRFAPICTTMLFSATYLGKFFSMYNYRLEKLKFTANKFVIYLRERPTFFCHLK